ncbi:NAD(P)H-dependent oxidoreductase [Chryseobacterium populi]|uniref:Putative NADPH-quinone reductase (Modulator of drug activity B) n=1 Tax=Chryseobacterium populi TaxID=1144316 RepID=J3CKU8_9FLAO|nr:NAD(P)H-dependent oxidoreductase [Chryseobacterium populi]EJL73599.1 putative NADPH-quinone reductase (modulator of drug activity B) [Chryseobacterium populi]
MALIILGHPNIEQSSANKAIIEKLKNSSLKVEIRDLSKLYPDFKIDPKAEQEALIQHETIIFQYPLYWYTMPAILKHWFDVVFEYQFAYGSQGNKLKGKNFVPSFTVGGPETEYHTLGEHHFRVHEFCKNLEQTAYFAQMNYIEPFYFHGTSLNAGYTKEDVKRKARKQAKSLIEKLEKQESDLTSTTNKI